MRQAKQRDHESFRERQHDQATPNNALIAISVAVPWAQGRKKLMSSKEAEVKKSATKQDPKTTVKLSENKTGDPAFNPEHLNSARRLVLPR